MLLDVAVLGEAAAAGTSSKGAKRAHSPDGDEEGYKSAIRTRVLSKPVPAKVKKHNTLQANLLQKHAMHLTKEISALTGV